MYYLNSNIIEQLNNFLKEHKTVSFNTTQLYSDFFKPLNIFYPANGSEVGACLKQPCNSSRLWAKVEKIKNRYYYQYEEKINLSLTGYHKVKNILYFENKENIPFYYDFATQTMNIPAKKIYSLWYINSKIRSIYNYATLKNSNFFMKEWIFSYPELWDRNERKTLCIEFDCPAGYINYLKTNHLYISQDSYNSFRVFSVLPDKKRILTTNWSYVIDRLTPVNKEYLFAHPILFSLIHKMFIIDAKNFMIESSPYVCTIDIISYCSELKAEDNNFTMLNSNRGLAYNKNLLSEIYNSKKNEILATKLQVINAINHFQISDYEVIVPQNLTDLQNEGKQQNNCVGYYYNNSIMRGENYIYFLRKKINPNDSYMTCRFNVYNKATTERYYKNNRYVNNKKELEILKQIDEKIRQILSI